MTIKPIWTKARSAAFVAPLLLAAVALALRAHRLEVQSLWLDEGLSVIFAQTPLSDLLPRVMKQDIHPPLYILGLHFWMQVVGSSEFAIRYLSAILGVLLVPIAYRLALDLFGDENGPTKEARLSAVLVGALVAVSPFLVYYSQEARNYIGVTLFSAFTCLAFWRALITGRPRWWVAYSVGAAAVVYTHYYGGFVLAAQAAYLAVTWAQHRARMKAWLLAAIGAVVLYLPWLFGLRDQIANIWRSPDYWFGTIDLGTVVWRTFASFSLGRADFAGPMLALFGVLFLVGAVVLLGRGGLRSRRGELFLLFYAVVPVIAVYAISARNPKFAERYLIIVSPAFYLVLARGLAALYGLGTQSKRFWPQAPAVGMTACLLGAALAVGFSASATWQVYYGPEWAKDDYRGAIQYIEEHSRPGDFVLLVRNSYHPFQYYNRTSLSWKGFDPVGPNRAPNPVYIADVLNKNLKGQERVWLLLWQEEVVDPTRTVSGLLRRFGSQVPVPAAFTGLRLELFELQPDVVFRGFGQWTLDVAYENGVQLRGVDLLNPSVRPDELIDLSLYWQATRPLSNEIGIGFTLRDDRGFVWAAETHRPSSQYLPATRWSVEYGVRGAYPIAVPAGTPPGRYKLEMNVHDATSLRELSRVMPNGQPLGTRLEIAQIEVLPAAPDGSAPSMASSVGETLMDKSGNGVSLLGTGKLPVELEQGATADLSLYWQRAGSSKGDHEVVVRLVGSQTAIAARASLVERYPTETWAAAERLRGQYRLSVPPTLAPGDYEVQVSVVSRVEGHELATGFGKSALTIGNLRIRDLPRVTQAPAVSGRQGTVYGEAIQLYGFEPVVQTGPVKAGDKIDLELVWRAEGVVNTSYSVFVHLADANQRPWAQHDGVPANGNRPTTSWVPGEYVTDRRVLTVGSDVPPGHYRVLVGLYGPDGTRLNATDAGGRAVGNAIQLNGLEIEVVR